jgi:hypothetical protein
VLRCRTARRTLTMVQPIGDIKGIPPVAGIRQNKNEMDTAKGCLTQNVVRSQTPPHVRKWRKSMFSEPGQRVLHPVSTSEPPGSSLVHFWT